MFRHIGQRRIFRVISSSPDFDGKGILKHSLLSGNLLALLLEMLNVDQGGLPCHRLVDSLPIGDASPEASVR